jgi:hypothetical protein
LRRFEAVGMANSTGDPVNDRRIVAGRVGLVLNNLDRRSVQPGAVCFGKISADQAVRELEDDLAAVVFKGELGILSQARFNRAQRS